MQREEVKKFLNKSGISNKERRVFDEKCDYAINEWL